MADTIAVTPGSGAAVATDDIAGVHYQKIKAGWGPDNTWNETADVDGVRLPVGGAQVGAINEAAPASDIANSGLNGRLQRIAQRLTSLIALLPAALGAGGGLKVDGSGTALPVSGTVTATIAALAAATATNAASGTGDVQIVAAATSLRLLGLTAKESAGTAAPASFVLRHGTSTAGTPLAHVTLGSGESIRDWFGPGGMIAASGIFLDRLSGTTDVTVHTVVAA